MVSRHDLLAGFLDESHLVVPDDIPRLVQDHAARMGTESAVLHLVDLDQRTLIPLGHGADRPDPVPVDGSRAGESYRRIDIVEHVDATGARSVWIPMVDGTERLGVIEYRCRAGDEPDLDTLRALTGLTAELVLSKSQYGDFFEIARRRSPISVTAELLWQLLPPLTFATEELVITGFFVPTDDIGGDAFDYGVDAQHARVAIFDAMGHGLSAGLMATTAVAAFRNARREPLALDASASHIGRSIATQFGDDAFVTGVLASLARRSGELTWVSAGHPPPLLLRAGAVAEPQSIGGQPFGVGGPSRVMRAQLGPGDRLLLYTDGITEARTLDGVALGVEQLVELVSHVAAEERSPEVLRRVMHAVVDHSEVPMRDDATLLMVEWRGESGRELIP